MSRRPILRALAAEVGIISEYSDHRHRKHRTRDATRAALLAAMGFDVSTEAAAARALEQRRREAAAAVLLPVRVVSPSAAARLEINATAVPGDPADAIEWGIELHHDDGTIDRNSGRCRAASAVILRLPGRLTPGYYRLRLTARRHTGGAIDAQQTLIVAPPRCPLPASVLGRRKIFGLLVNLYTVRSAKNWGAGDLGDLHALIAWGSQAGAAFIGLNPLHALGNAGDEISPYSPTSRLYRNVLYLDVAAVPELSETPIAQERMGSADFQSELARVRARERIDYEGVMALKVPLLRALHRTFAESHRDRDDERGRAYRQYCEREGQQLLDFATYCALQTYLAERHHGRDWRGWPEPFRDCRSPAVEWFRDERREDVDFHRYQQFELDRQLALIGADAKRQRLPLGVYQDLAIGSSAGGSDTWSFPSLFLHAVRVGAPPDEYNTQGQNWEFPPVDPHQLTAQHFAYWVQLVRAALHHAGALRIDHIMGLYRQYWIPNGWSPAHGAYVRYPADALFGILALESTRAGAVVVGEDLGTVPREIPPLLARWGVLSSRVLYFERDARGAYRSARSYPARALVGANTHDLPTLAAFWRGADLELRRALGIYATDAALRRANNERQRERRALVRRLRRERLLPAAQREFSDVEIRAAVHAFLCRTPAALVGVALNDVAGEVEPVNIPGVGLGRYPSWSRRLPMPLEALNTDPAAARVLAGTGKRRWRKH